MNIIHIKFTNLAKAPDDLNSSIKQYAIKYPNRKITTSLIFEPNPKESYKKVVSSLQLGKLNILLHLDHINVFFLHSRKDV